MYRKILVTGGAGFIGSNLIKELAKDVNNQITSLDCYFTGKKENHIAGVEYVEGYTWNIEKIFDGRSFDLIFHFGEYSRIVHSFSDISFVHESILRGTPKVFELARKCSSKIIYSASSSKFGNNGDDENLSPYAWMKSKMVELLKNYGVWFNLKFEICYFFNVYGERQIHEGNYATVVAIFERLYKENKKLTVVKPGTQSRDFTHVNDIVRGVLLTIEKDMNYEWHLRSGINVSIIDLAEKFGEWEFIEERKGERFTSVLFNSDTNRMLGWSPSESLDQWILNIKNSVITIDK